MNLHYDQEFNEHSSRISEEEAHHLLNVLRKKTGDTIFITNGKGSVFQCRISSLDKKGCSVSIEKTTFYPTVQPEINLFISVLKTSERMEWLVEKATEIGVSSIGFFISARTERKNVNLNKLNNIAIAAIKQSGRCWLPRITGPHPISEILETEIGSKWICTLSDPAPPFLKNVPIETNNVCVLVGPEGDFSAEEEKAAFTHGFKPVTLGKFTLRAETAGLVAVQTLIDRGNS